MEIVEYKEDRVWEQVLEQLSQGGRLARFQRLPKHELNAYLRLFGKSTSHDLRKVFAMVQSQSPKDLLQKFIEDKGEQRVYSMLYQLIGCMKCWVESESPVQSVRARWRIAHS